MRFLLFVGQPIALIYAAMRLEWLASLLGWLFIAGAIGLIVVSFYRHIAANRQANQSRP